MEGESDSPIKALRWHAPEPVELFINITILMFINSLFSGVCQKNTIQKWYFFILQLRKFNIKNYKLALIIKSNILVKSIPILPTASGNKLVGVMPGIVFVSIT
jgi:hypothetical protein